MRKLAALVACLAAGLRAGQAFAEAWTAAKRAHAVLDFDDLIRLAERLLLTRRNGRVGALQARPEHRSYPRRRGPGQQRGAVEHRARLDARIFRGGGGVEASPHPVHRRATTSRPSSASRAPIRQASSWRGPGSPARRRGWGATSAICRWTGASAPRRRSSRPSTPSSPSSATRRSAFPGRPTGHESHHAARPGSVTLWPPAQRGQ
jgi:ATP-dependent helicase/nuclease subunit A